MVVRRVDRVSVAQNPRIAPDAMLNAPPVLVPPGKVDLPVYPSDFDGPTGHVERHGENSLVSSPDDGIKCPRCCLTLTSSQT